MYIHHYKSTDEEGYYVAAFDTWGKNIRTSLVHDIREWCKQTYGKIDNYNPNPRWKDDIIWGEVRFRDQSDLMTFLLRWE